jgi:integration host factor subunit beta
MTKHDLIEELAARHALHFSRPVAERVVKAFFEGIVQALARGERVELRGFGVFTVKSRLAYEAHDPRTREFVAVPARKVPAFKAAKGLRRQLNKT